MLLFLVWPFDYDWFKHWSMRFYSSSALKSLNRQCNLIINNAACNKWAVNSAGDRKMETWLIWNRDHVKCVYLKRNVNAYLVRTMLWRSPTESRNPNKRRIRKTNSFILVVLTEACVLCRAGHTLPLFNLVSILVLEEPFIFVVFL